MAVHLPFLAPSPVQPQPLTVGDIRLRDQQPPALLPTIIERPAPPPSPVPGMDMQQWAASLMQTAAEVAAAMRGGGALTGPPPLTLASLAPGGVSKPKPDTEATRIKPTIERYLKQGHPPLSPELREYRDDHQEFERYIIRSLPMMRQRFRDDPVRLRFLDDFERQFLRQPPGLPGGAST